MTYYDDKNKHVVLVNTLIYTKQIIAELKNAPIFNKIVADLSAPETVKTVIATPAKVAVVA